ncbi:U3 small nucleolar RNA-associated protein 6-domain-containing protein [Crassisporium funariophilum]|nr:U3 small nucleolar RNA-associated protein 6-domain-containing protein [Crassisporium funariophilum]
MERVQFQQEQMLNELKDLVEKNLFTEKETKQIMKQRTAYETSLVRRIAKKADFLRYASYEMALEQLRRKRVERMKLPPAPATVSDYALVRRQFHIFERAVRKFKSDVGLWVQYIQVAKKEGARALVGRITARSLQLHPNKPALYILAASHELDHLSPSAARTLLQRGIRLNTESIDIWREYVKMELGFVESLRRRWDVLGIKVAGSDEVEKKEDPSRHIMGARDYEEAEEASSSMEVEYGGDSGAEARKQVMDGAIVASVISSAARAIPRFELFESIKEAISNYPSPESLRTALLNHLYDEMRRTLPDDPKAVVFVASRLLAGENDLVESLKVANEEIVARVKMSRDEKLNEAYAGFVEDWCGRNIDENLARKHYLIASLERVIVYEKASPSLLCAHIKVLGESGVTGPAKVLRLGQKYTEVVPRSARVWVARLEAAARVGGVEGSEEIWAAARASAQGTETEMLAVWTWGLSAGDVARRRRVHEGLLVESLRDAGLGGIHEVLLLSYVSVLEEEIARSDQSSASAFWQQAIGHMARHYLTGARVWQKVFRTVGDEQSVYLAYLEWRQTEAVAAGAAWREWKGLNGK